MVSINSLSIFVSTFSYSRRLCGAFQVAQWRHRFDPWVRKIPWRRVWEPTSVFLPRESHGGGAWWTIVQEVTKSHTCLKQLSMHADAYILKGDISTSSDKRNILLFPE